MAPPLEVADLLLCMGSNAGTACGLAVSTKQKIVSFMGDSTFFHAGIPPIIDAVHHNHDVVITVLDNRTTAMTGHQPHPGTDFDGMGRHAAGFCETPAHVEVRAVSVVEDLHIVNLFIRPHPQRLPGEPIPLGDVVHTLRTVKVGLVELAPGVQRRAGPVVKHL